MIQCAHLLCALCEFRSGISIQDLHMLFLMEQRLVFMLSVNVDQQFRKLFDLLCRYGLAVNTADALPRGQFSA